MYKNQKGFSLIELLIVVAIIGIIAAIAIPNLLSSRRAANEGSAVSAMRTIGSAQATYLSTAGNGQFATDLAGLRDSGGNTIGLVDQVLAGGTKSGYTFTSARLAAVAGSPERYDTTAVPTSFTGLTATGTRSFYSNEDGVIFAVVGGTPPTANATTRAITGGTPLQ